MRRILPNKTDAIKIAKTLLRNKHGVMRLGYTKIKPTSIMCGCGETEAIELISHIKGDVDSVTVGICKNCSK